MNYVSQYKFGNDLYHDTTIDPIQYGKRLQLKGWKADSNGHNTQWNMATFSIENLNLLIQKNAIDFLDGSQYPGPEVAKKITKTLFQEATPLVDFAEDNVTSVAERLGLYRFFSEAVRLENSLENVNTFFQKLNPARFPDVKELGLKFSNKARELASFINPDMLQSIQEGIADYLVNPTQKPDLHRVLANIETIRGADNTVQKDLLQHLKPDTQTDALKTLKAQLEDQRQNQKEAYALLKANDLLPSKSYLSLPFLSLLTVVFLPLVCLGLLLIPNGFTKLKNAFVDKLILKSNIFEAVKTSTNPVALAEAYCTLKTSKPSQLRSETVVRSLFTNDDPKALADCLISSLFLPTSETHRLLGHSAPPAYYSTTPSAPEPDPKK